ncbi:uncharacterized protein LOC143182813 [Calliopsis andreniformis]|uniref:uncharacterized protein LOC143182813 n=1 Tax=Calliopsis andreniformis TaxID=337506 RepID=UPI003FCEB864
MTTRYDNRQQYDVVEFLKKSDYKESSSGSESRKSERGMCRLMKLKTLPQAQWHEMDKVMADLKDTLPDISRKEVRRFYRPYHEAILLELEEEEYEEAGYHMKELLRLDEGINKKSSDVITLQKPFLKDQKDFIDRLKEGLVKFEEARRRGDDVTRAMSLLDTAVFFQLKTWEWWWLAERLYQAALFAAENIENDNNYTVSMTRYLYGRFLFQQLQNPQEALDYLDKARLASERKPWNASKKLGEKQASVHIECNILLYKALLILVRKERPNDPHSALKSCIEALERATDSGSSEYVNGALYELGKSYVAVKDIKRALQSFSKLLALAKRIPDVEGICNAHMELAFAYKQLDDNDHTEKHLRMFREVAEKFDLFQRLADAHYYSGEHYLSQNKLDLSTAHLESALALYNRLNLSREADRARSIAGISKGQERIEEYFKMITRCGEYDQEATIKLCKWKSSRQIFWALEADDEKSELEVPCEKSEDTISIQSFLKD